MIGAFLLGVLAGAGFRIWRSAQTQDHLARVLVAAEALSEQVMRQDEQYRDLLRNDDSEAGRWRAVKGLLVGADFAWGDPPQPIVAFRLPVGVCIGADADAFADAVRRQV
jgi:hypothetical protein